VRPAALAARIASFRPGKVSVVAPSNPSRASRASAVAPPPLTEPAALQDKVITWPEKCRGKAGRASVTAAGGSATCSRLPLLARKTAARRVENTA
jgi:hypothetical protein